MGLTPNPGKRHRSDLLWLAAGFLFLQAGLALAVHFLRPALRDPIYFGRVAQFAERIQGAPSPLSIVMLGSSRTAYGFRGGLVETALGSATARPVVICNLGCCGTAHLNELIFLKRLL